MDKIIFEDTLVFLGLIVGMGCLTGIVITFLKRKAARIAPEVGTRLAEIADRLARLENSVDATAVEVERISEAQRFTARVLAERSTSPILPERKSITPH